MLTMTSVVNHFQHLQVSESTDIVILKKVNNSSAEHVINVSHLKAN